MKSDKILTILCLAGLLLLACNFPTAIQQKAPQDPPVLFSPTQASTQMELQPTATNLPEQPVEAPTLALPAEPTLAATAIPENTAAPTLAPTASPADCLVGTWETTDLSPYIMAAINATGEASQVTYKSTSGKAYLVLTKDGNATLRFEQLEFLFDAQLSIFTVPLTVDIDGSAPGKYLADSNTLQTTNMQTSGLNVSAKAMGQDVADRSQILSAIPLLQSPFDTASYTCQGDNLSLKVQAYGDNIPPLSLQRIH